LLLSRKAKWEIQELFVSLRRARSATFEVDGSGMLLERLRNLHERGNYADKIIDSDGHT
jgi:hypothetical protein